MRGGRRARILRRVLHGAFLGILPVPLSAAGAQAPAGAPEPAPANGFASVRYLLDASGSMRARFGQTTKLDAAREMLLALDGELARGGATPRPSLWVYGARSPRRDRNCRDAVPVASGRGRYLARALAALVPTGVSPLLFALDALDALGSGAERSEAWVVFTDGSDTCGRDPCAWASAAAARPERPRIYVVGIGIAEEDERALRCLTDATSGVLLDVEADAPWQADVARLAATLQNRGTLRIEARVADQPVAIQGRVFRAGSETAVGRLRTGRSETLPGGMYRIVAETLPPSVFERVMVLPGQESVLSIDDLAQLRAAAYDGRNRPLPAYLSLARADGEGGEMYASTARPAYVRAGSYRLALEVGDSVALRRTLDLRAGETRTLSVGGTGFVVARAPGLPELSGIGVELHDYAGGTSSVDPWDRAVQVPAGEYRAVIHTLPLYVEERFTVTPAETSELVVPGLGILQVDVTDPAGRPLTMPVTLLRPEEAGPDASGEGLPGAVLGGFPSGVRQAVPAGTYDVLLESEPPRVERQIRVSPGTTRTLSFSLPGTAGGEGT